MFTGSKHRATELVELDRASREPSPVPRPRVRAHAQGHSPALSTSNTLDCVCFVFQLRGVRGLHAGIQNQSPKPEEHVCQMEHF